MSAINSVGKCFFCNAEFKKAGISKHLNTHIAKERANNGTSFHIRIEDDPRFGGLFFLNLWVDGNALMSEIDDFLRNIWLECCGHMSAFTNPKERKRHSMFDMDEIESEADEIMDSSTKDILTKGMKLKYEYDFGSTTTLFLTVAEQFPVEVPGGIILLSRNEPLEIICEVCKSAPASTICTTCYEPNTFCKKCAKQHAKTCEDFADYSAMPVVNSPRMGVCAYEGGVIDKKRDGIFVKK
jgi:hypothetical protein